MNTLGRGSYAEIFVARDTLSSPQSPHHQVVIKALNVFLQDEIDADLERTLVENFQNEAIALDRVRHPNIISRHGHGTARDLNGLMFHYLVLEYLEGGDLQRSVREQSLTEQDVMTYLEQVCSGLIHAHRNGIIHRDIKPQNILLTKDRQTAKIADFGVARIFHTDAPVTRVGTNIYAPPEHSPLLSGVGREVSEKLTPAADIYSLGKTLYTLLTGEAPRIYANQMITELPVNSRDKDWAESLKRVLTKATNDDPRGRHDSVEDFWLDLIDVRDVIMESKTVVRSNRSPAPQPRISRGYTPLIPRQPKFDTTTGLRKNKIETFNTSPLEVEMVDSSQQGNVPRAPLLRAENYWPEQPKLQIPIESNAEILPERSIKKRGFLKRMAYTAAFIAAFAIVLYGTAVYLRSSETLFGISNPFTGVTYGRANTDVNLRPSPSASNEPIGIVTRNSVVKIVKTESNWYQVEVIKQGRDTGTPLSTNKGWLSSRYVDLQNN